MMRLGAWQPGGKNCLLVCAVRHLYRLPNGSRRRSLCAGWLWCLPQTAAVVDVLDGRQTASSHHGAYRLIKIICLQLVWSKELPPHHQSVFVRYKKWNIKVVLMFFHICVCRVVSENTILKKICSNQNFSIQCQLQRSYITITLQ